MKHAIRYGSSDSQVADFLRPASGGEHWPIACLLHGGFWRVPHGREQMDAVAVDLAMRGYAVWNIGYRRVGEPGGGWPGTFEDVAAAIDHLAVLALDEPRLDLDRVAVAGHSAGGQLALCVAASRHRDTRRFAPAKVAPKAACALAPIADLERAFEIDAGNGAVADLLGGPPRDFAERYAHASPRHLLPLGARQLVMHGSDDSAVPPALSAAYARAARRAGDDVEDLVLVGMGHMEFLDPASCAHDRLCRWLDLVLGDRTPAVARR